MAKPPGKPPALSLTVPKVGTIIVLSERKKLSSTLLGSSAVCYVLSCFSHVRLFLIGLQIKLT